MKKALSILLIEDDLIEVMKFKRVLKSITVNHKIIEATNGEDALSYLNKRESMPDIILLDLNMPKMNGIEFLKILKKDDLMKFIPTIILTTSSNQKDLLEVYKIGVAGYITKPLKYEDYVEKINRLLNYWSVNELLSK
jgi:CheY-like chemotaxis protein